MFLSYADDLWARGVQVIWGRHNADGTFFHTVRFDPNPWAPL